MIDRKHIYSDRKVKFYQNVLENRKHYGYNIIIKFLGENKIMANAKNYTDEMVNEMTEQYSANPTRETVDALAKALGKNTRSVIAKLSREGVYVAQPRATKSGEPIVRKAELVAQIQELTGGNFPTLVKASKAD